MQTSYIGKILRVNLTTHTLTTEYFDIDLAIKFIGGRGLGTKWLYDEGVATVDPLGENNKLVYLTGPMTGTSAPTSGRYMVITKSPLTNLIACSNAGGIWGAMLKYAGWDGIIVEGRSNDPVYLNIVDKQVELLPANLYWGMTSGALDHELKQAHPKCSVLSIGPAGEQQSLLACIINDKNRAAGRGGVGAVMGSKRLKAITISASRRSVRVADARALRSASNNYLKIIKKHAITGNALPTYGTAVLVNIINNAGVYPTRNWQESHFDAAGNTSGEALKQKLLAKQSFCHRCPIGCGRVIKLNGQHISGPEHAPIWAYGANCGVDDIAAISEANFWCNEYGLDAISTPCTIAAAMELYEKGLINNDHCDNVPLTWGSATAIVEWTKRMGQGQLPLAKLMANGSHRLCTSYGHAELSMSVKKQELPSYDARGVQGIGVTYATSNRGGCHVRGYTITPEIIGLPEKLDRTATEGKAFWVKILQDLTAVIDSMGMCLFSSFALSAPQYTNLLNAATGTKYNVEELLKVGERIYNMERMFNRDAGMKAEDDTLPLRLLNEAVKKGPSEGMVHKLEIVLPQYYKERGWVDGFPTQETLQRLDLI